MKHYLYPGVIRDLRQCGVTPTFSRKAKRQYARNLRQQLRAECRNPEIIDLPQNPGFPMKPSQKRIASAHWTGKRLILNAA